MLSSEKYIPKIIEKAISDGEIAGANVMGIKDGKTLYKGNFGYADREKGTPMTDDTIFRMFSMTKPVTTAAAMILIERGLLRYTDKVKDFFPEFNNMNVISDDGTLTPANEDITIRHLLSMTSGLVYPEDSAAGRLMGSVYWEISQRMNTDNPLTTNKIVKKMGDVPLMFSPGEKWHYGVSADVMGGIIEVVSGKTLGKFMKDEIFDPLGMNDTGFYVKPENYSRLSKAYEKTVNGLKPYKGMNLCISDTDKSPAFESGGAGLFSTITDYAKFGNFMLTGKNEGDEKILGRKTLELMRMNMLSEEQKKYAHEWDSIKGYGYGSFMRILEDKTVLGICSSEGEFGWDGWTGNYFSADPKENVVFLYFIQVTGAGTTDTLYRIKNIFYSDI